MAILAAALCGRISFSSPLVGILPASFLHPFQTPMPAARRYFFATTGQLSKLGRTPISIPPGVEFTVTDLITLKRATSWKPVSKRTLSVTGPLGKLKIDVLPFLNISYDQNTRRVALSVQNKEEKQQRAMWGTYWANLNNFILGVSEGHTAILRLVGIGYRASVETLPHKEEYPDQPFVVLKLGFSHPVEMGVPKGIKASTPQPTRILLEGIDKEKIKSFAADIRKWRRPEPYKGKGIFVNDETIKLKQKKIK